MPPNHAARALYWGLVLARLEAIDREMSAMRPAVDAYLRKHFTGRTA